MKILRKIIWSVKDFTTVEWKTKKNRELEKIYNDHIISL